MKNIKSFTIRSLGRIPDHFCIDSGGMSEIGDISEMTGIEASKLEEVYLQHGAHLDESAGVYCFPSREQAISALKALEECFTAAEPGKLVFLTFEEMEYIRQTLINEGSNIIYVRNDLKRVIFDKFNS